MNISKNLKKIRKEKQYSLEQIARLTGLSLNTIVKIENGKNQNPTIQTMMKIAESLGVSVNDLIK